MRLFTDGAEYADVLFFDTVNGDVTAAASGQPIGSWAYYFNLNVPSAIKQFPSISEGYLRQRIKWNSPGSQYNPYYMPIIRYNGNDIADVRFNSSSFLCLYIGGVEKAVGGVVSASTWYLMELYYKIDSTSGSFVMKMDGLPYISFVGNTRAGYDYFNQLYWKAGKGTIRGTDAPLWIDDLALNDTSGSADNSWVGNAYIEALMPNQEGDTLQWTPTSGSHWENVDERPHDTDTTYIQALLDAQKRDMFNITTISDSNRIIKRLFTEARMRDTQSGAAQIRLGMKTSGSVITSEPRILGSTYARIVGDEFRTNPTSGSVWTKTDIDSLQVVLQGDYV